MASTNSAPGALIPLDGTLNLRDLGGWQTADGSHRVAHGRLYRSDRLSDLSVTDHRVLESYGIDTVVDLRYEAEAAEHPSRLWATVERHHEIPMGGDLADQRSFVERALAGDYDGITDAQVGESYVEFLQTHAVDFGWAVQALLAGGAGLYHCTAGKDRTGLLSMLVLRSVGVGDGDVLADFVLSNEYRAEKRMAQLAPTFAEQGLDIEDFRPALSAPRPALVMAMAWLDEEHGTAEQYLAGPGRIVEPGARLRARLLEPAS